MTRRIAFASLALTLALSALLSPPARAAGDGRLRLEILVNGRPVDEYASRGTTYVEALRGREYAVRLTNLEPVRVAVALAVDGRNTIDGRRTTARDARKWILEPWQSITVSGWQVDDRRARHFYFTTEESSYAEWLGDTRNVGLVEAVSFRERPYERDVVTSERGGGRHDGDEPWERESRSRSKSGSASPQNAPSASAERSGPVAQGASPAPSWGSEDSEAREEAATGAGRDVRNDVVRVQFEHEDWASSQVRIRYEWRDRLVAMGILPRYERRHDDWRRRERASGFSEGWCPEPPRRW